MSESAAAIVNGINAPMNDQILRLQADPDLIRWLDSDGAWPGLHSIAEVTDGRRIGDRTTVEIRYYLSRLPGYPTRIGQAVSAHWGIANGLHWGLDMGFSEDENPEMPPITCRYCTSSRF